MKSQFAPNPSNATRLLAFLLWNYTVHLSVGLRTKTTNARAVLLARWEATREQYESLILMAKGGFGGRSPGGAASHAKGLLLVIIMILLIPAVALIFTGPTVNSTGVYTNSTVANQARNGIVQFSQFIGVAMILGVVGVIVALV